MSHCVTEKYIGRKQAKTWNLQHDPSFEKEIRYSVIISGRHIE